MVRGLGGFCLGLFCSGFFFFSSPSEMSHGKSCRLLEEEDETPEPLELWFCLRPSCRDGSLPQIVKWEVPLLPALCQFSALALAGWHEGYNFTC